MLQVETKQYKEKEQEMKTNKPTESATNKMLELHYPQQQQFVSPTPTPFLQKLTELCSNSLNSGIASIVYYTDTNLLNFTKEKVLFNLNMYLSPIQHTYRSYDQFERDVIVLVIKNVKRNASSSNLKLSSIIVNALNKDGLWDYSNEPTDKVTPPVAKAEAKPTSDSELMAKLKEAIKPLEAEGKFLNDSISSLEAILANCPDSFNKNCEVTQLLSSALSLYKHEQDNYENTANGKMYKMLSGLIKQ